MNRERSLDSDESGEQPDPLQAAAPETGSPAVELKSEWAVPGAVQESVLAEGLELMQAGLQSLRAVGVSGWWVDDVTVRDGVRDLDTFRQQVEHLWLGLVHELDGRPGAVPGSRAGGVARRFLTDGLNKAPGQARRDVAAARAMFHPDPDRPEGEDFEAGDPGVEDPDAGRDQAETDESESESESDADGDSGSALRSLTDLRSRLARMGAAFEAGDISRDHLDAAVECLRHVPRHLARAVDPETGITGTQRVDEFMADQAYQFDPRRLRNLSKHLLAVLDPDGQKAGFDPDAYLRRDLRLIPAPDGMTIIRGQVDAAAVVWLKAALDHYAAPERDTPLTGGTGGQGELQVDVTNERTPGQRNADALIAIARRALDSQDIQVRRETPHVFILTDPDQLADAHTRTPGKSPSVRNQRNQRNQRDLKTTIEVAARTSRTGPPPGDPPAEPLGEPPAEPEDFEKQHDGPRFNRAVGLAEIAKIGSVPPDVLALLTCDALLQAVVLGADTSPSTGALLDLPTPQRTATRAQRRALAARDKGQRPGTRITITRNALHDAITRAQRLAQQMRLDLEPPDETLGRHAA